jgi:hypothetical protein
VEFLAKLTAPYPVSKSHSQSNQKGSEFRAFLHLIFGFSNQNSTISDYKVVNYTLPIIAYDDNIRFLEESIILD